MKLYKIYFFIFLLTFQYAVSQNVVVKFGEVDEKDVRATQYEQFPNAEAIILCDYGSISYKLGGEFAQVQERIRRIKILKKTGYAHANHEVYYVDNGVGKISGIKGYAYNVENDKIVKAKLEKKDIFEKKINKYLRQVKFTLPNVKEGTVIEYTYEIKTNFEREIPTWFFQNPIPTLWSEYKIDVPEYMRFAPIKQVFLPFFVESSSHQTENFFMPQGTRQGIDYESYKHRWVLMNVPAFKGEKFIASFKDCVMKVDFQLSAISMPGQKIQFVRPSWETISESLLIADKFKAYLEDELPVPGLLSIILKDKNDNKEKVTAICNYVKSNFTHNDRIGIFPRKTIREFFEKKTGNCAEINLLIVNMLKKAGIKAYPVLLSTRGNGRLYQDKPNPEKLNYLIAYAQIDEKEDMLLDATDAILPAGMIDYEALNGYGLVAIKDELASWANLQNSKYSKTSNITIANLTMKTTGMVAGDVTQRYGGYEGVKMRKKMIKKTKTALDEEDEDISMAQGEGEGLDSIANSKLNQIIFKNLNDFDKPLDGSMQIETSAHSQVNDDFIYLTPLLDYRMKENPFKAETRNFPIDYACAMEQSFYMNFTIPEGYKVEEMPKPMRIKWQDESIKYDYMLTISGDKIQLMSKFTLTRPIFQAEEYKALRELYAQIVAKQEEQIVFKKK